MSQTEDIVYIKDLPESEQKQLKKIAERHKAMLDAFDLKGNEKWKKETAPQIQALKEVMAESPDVLFAPGVKVSELNAFVNKAKKILDDVRKKEVRRPKGSTKEKTQIRKDDIVKLYEKYKSIKKGKKTDFFDLRKSRFTDQEIHNLIKAKFYPDLATSTIAKYIKDHKK